MNEPLLVVVAHSNAAGPLAANVARLGHRRERPLWVGTLPVSDHRRRMLRPSLLVEGFGRRPPARGEARSVNFELSSNRKDWKPRESTAGERKSSTTDRDSKKSTGEGPDDQECRHQSSPSQQSGFPSDKHKDERFLHFSRPVGRMPPVLAESNKGSG
jgi:hypothetical protein